MTKVHKFRKFLTATPFEANGNLGGDLTPGLFFQELFHDTLGINQIISQIKETLIDNPYENNFQALFLDGYKGIGKTTFLRKLAKDMNSWNFTFLDFYRDDQKNQKTESKTESVDPFKLNTSFFLKSRNESKTDFRHFIAKKKDYLTQYLYGIASLLSEYTPNEDSKFFDILDKAQPQDVFKLFLLYLVRKKIIRKHEGQEETVLYDLIVLDNIDAVHLANLTSFVKEDFTQVLESFQSLLQDLNIFSIEERDYIDFPNTFKFILCLRDSNKAMINHHRNDRLDEISTSLSINNFESSLYDVVLQKRLDFYTKLRGNTHSPEISQIIYHFRGLSNKGFFKSVICPLYNWNFRRITKTYNILIDLKKAEEAINNGIPVNLFNTNISKISKYGEYGKFGAIFFQTIKILRHNDFLRNYPFDEIGKEELLANGYCVPLRIILTVLLNMSDVNKVSDILDDGKSCKDVSVTDLYKELKGVISLDDFSQIISDIFNFHIRGWGHLITCRKDSIENSDAVKTIIEAHNDSVSISLNPAGFVFLRNVLTHFEFYSVLFGISETPLFLLGLKKDKKDKYLFESVIEKVYEEVKTHCGYMKIFFNKKFVEEKRMTSEDYLASKFAFKHFEFRESSNRKGLFHATRLATYHIRYLDYFRRWILETSTESRIIKENINRILISHIEKYREILSDWEGLVTYRNRLDTNLEKIKEANYSADIDITISPNVMSD